MYFNLCHLVRLAVPVLCIATAAPAASVFINAPERAGGPASSLAGAKIRASNADWDLSLDAGGGTSPGNSIQAELSDNFSTRNRTINFTLEHRAGEGIIFRAAEGTNPEVILAWGTFSTPVSGTLVVPTINSKTPPQAFNFLNLQAVADTSGARVTFSNLLFSSPTLDIGSGAFQNGTVESSTPGGVGQSLIADTSLGDHNWSLTGIVSLQRPGRQPGSDDNVRFEITAGAAPFLTVIPEPASALLTVPAAFLLWGRRRRHQA